MEQASIAAKARPDPPRQSEAIINKNRNFFDSIDPRQTLRQSFSLAFHQG
jgi:hypothetical protein